MKIAIDESGDSGRKFWRGSSKWFILTAVIVPENDTCGPICQAVESYREINGNGRELHFAHSSHEQHVDFFRYIKDQDFIFASVCINKRRLIAKRPHVFRTKMALMRFAFDRLFSELKPWLDDPVVLIDTSGSKYLNRALSRHLIQAFGPRHKGDIRSIEQVRMVDSSVEPLVQLADYVAGAIHHYVDGRQGSIETYNEYLQEKGRIFYV